MTPATPSRWYSETMEALDRASESLRRAREQVRAMAITEAQEHFRRAAEIAKQGREVRS